MKPAECSLPGVDQVSNAVEFGGGVEDVAAKPAGGGVEGGAGLPGVGNVDIRNIYANDLLDPFVPQRKRVFAGSALKMNGPAAGNRSFASVCQ